MKEAGAWPLSAIDGGDDFALAILHWLWCRGYDAFLDVKDISAGEWLPQLLAGIDGAPNFILILSDGALDDPKEGKSDWMRKEIQHALRMAKNIVPIRLEEFVWPKPLPGDIEGLRKRQAILHNHLQSEQTFDRMEEFLRSRKRTYNS